jgi:hypothetical protein
VFDEVGVIGSRGGESGSGMSSSGAGVSLLGGDGVVGDSAWPSSPSLGSTSSSFW